MSQPEFIHHFRRQEKLFAYRKELFAGADKGALGMKQRNYMISTVLSNGCTLSKRKKFIFFLRRRIKIFGFVH